MLFSLLLKSILLVSLDIKAWVLEVLLFSEFLNIVFIFVIYFYWFNYVIPAFTCARAIDNLWNICLWVNIFSPVPFLLEWIIYCLHCLYHLNSLKYFPIKHLLVLCLIYMYHNQMNYILCHHSIVIVLIL